MERVSKIEDLKNLISKLKENNDTIGFVPTMGALHDGHLSLIKRCVAENDVCIVSIFVNPTQFNDKNDLTAYPRTIEADMAKLEPLGCTVLFTPEAEEFYTQEELATPFSFDFGGLDTVMEGKHRPGHFNGVVQVVGKLFDLIKPTRAYFGEKDFQQLAIIRRMVQLYDLPIEIVGCPIVREESGLAMSSRNALLSAKERQTAAFIHQLLEESRQFVAQTSVAELKEAVENAINAKAGLKIEYFDIVDGETLQPIEKWNEAASVIGCITVFCGKIRLIDNIQYK